MSDSLLAAAKRLAEIAGLQWSEVHPYYRTLQAEPSGEGWLPKSQGRNIWAAHPHFITRLLVALAGATRPAEASQVVEWVQRLTLNGREILNDEEPAANSVSPIEEEFSSYLTNPQKAAELQRVEVQPDTHSIVFTRKTGEQVIFSINRGYREGAGDEPRKFRGIYSRGVIDGLVFVYLAKTVNWRLRGEAPFQRARQSEAGED